MRCKEYCTHRNFLSAQKLKQGFQRSQSRGLYVHTPVRQLDRLQCVTEKGWDFVLLRGKSNIIIVTVINNSPVERVARDTTVLKRTIVGTGVNTDRRRLWQRQHKWLQSQLGFSVNVISRGRERGNQPRDGRARTRGAHFAFSRKHQKFSISPSSQDGWSLYYLTTSSQMLNWVKI